MKDSEFNDWKFEKDGKRCQGRYCELRLATGADYNNAAITIEKVVLDLEHVDSGQRVSIWLGEKQKPGKLLNLFMKEMARRAEIGKPDFEQDELITIEQSDEKRLSRKTGNSMWVWAVEFEHGAPPPTGAELLLGGPPPDVAAVVLDYVTAPVAVGAGVGPTDDIPFGPTVF